MSEGNDFDREVSRLSQDRYDLLLRKLRLGKCLLGLVAMMAEQEKILPPSLIREIKAYAEE
jgi:hypothetical protein